MAGQDTADGTPFGRYRLIDLLGEGGMGEVWRAHDTVTDRIVAIKVLSAKLSKDEEFQRRFRREAHAAARLETPHVVPIHDYGEIDGRLFVCMRLIKGRDLAAVLADGPLEPARAARIIGQVAEALHAAHGIGLIHRDIKPSNVLLDDRDFAYLIDFGIARVADDTRMTKTGNTIGTFAYIAPERLDGRGDEDARVDIYSLACVLYECLTGEPPFAADTMPRLIVAHMSSPPPRPSIARPDVPAQVDEVIATGMAKDPDQRYATTIELADAAREAITEPIQRPAANPTRIRETQPAHNVVTNQPATVKAEPPAPAKSAPPPTPTRVGGISRRIQIALIAGVVALVVVIAVVVGISALGKHGTSSSPSATSTTAAPTTTIPTGPPPVAETALEGLLLNPDQINTAMGATGMTPQGTFLMSATGKVSPPECLPILTNADLNVYAGSGYTAGLRQPLWEQGSSRNDHYVAQGVVLFSSAQAATAFFAASLQSWSACANRSYTDGDTGFKTGPVSTTNGTLTATFTKDNGNGWACQRALTARNNVVIDTMACSYNVTNQAVNIAHQIAAQVPTT